MSEFNLLFTSAGRRVSLIRHFRKTLGALGLQGRIITTDLKKTAPASFVADTLELVPRVTDPRYIETLLGICRKHRIRLLIPLIDSELHLLAPHREDFLKIGTTLLVSSVETNQICLDKRSTDVFFQQAGIPCPRILDPKKLLGDAGTRYPVFLKPADGSSSVGATLIRNAKELAFFVDYIPNAIVQERVEGDEYTLDVLVDFEGAVRSVVPRLRMETRAGEVSKGMTVKHPALIAAGKKVVEALPGAVGCITVQCFMTAQGALQFIEINPRFGGGVPLALEAGADFPRWIIQSLLGQKFETPIDGWKEGVVMLRYDDAVFVNRDQIQ